MVKQQNTDKKFVTTYVTKESRLNILYGRDVKMF